MQANFKTPRALGQEEKNMEELCKDPAYIEHLNKKAEEEQMMQMYEHNLEPC